MSDDMGNEIIYASLADALTDECDRLRARAEATEAQAVAAAAAYKQSLDSERAMRAAAEAKWESVPLEALVNMLEGMDSGPDDETAFGISYYTVSEWAYPAYWTSKGIPFTPRGTTSE